MKLPAAKKRRGKLHHLTHLLISSMEHLSKNKCILFSRNIFTITCKTQWKTLYYINFRYAYMFFVNIEDIFRIIIELYDWWFIKILICSIQRDNLDSILPFSDIKKFLRKFAALYSSVNVGLKRTCCCSWLILLFLYIQTNDHHKTRWVYN